MSDSNEKNGKKIPYFYQRLMHVFDRNDIRQSDVITKQEFNILVNHSFMLGKKDAKHILNELEQMKKVRRVDQGRIKRL